MKRVVQSRRRHRSQRRGLMLVLGAMTMTVILAFAAFAIDLGLIVLTAAQLQNAADAAALAAVLELKGADAESTKEELAAAAVARAKETAALNLANGRNVLLEDADITLGNRSYNSDLDDWITTEEGEPGFEPLPLNTVRVNVAYDRKDNSERREMDLYFARIMGFDTIGVGGESRSHLTPRDLVFVIDISGSMYGDSGGNTPTPFSGGSRKWTVLFLGPIYGGNRPEGSFEPAIFLSGSPPTPRYEQLWRVAMLGGAFGSTGQMAAFVNQEFPGFGTTDAAWATSEPWNHWKWRAYIDQAFCYSGGSNWNDPKTENVYEGRDSQIMNKNVVVAPPFRASSTAPARLGPESYTTFCVWNGYIPAIRGQQFYPRDADSDDTLDDPNDMGYPGEVSGAPYPDFVGYYPRVRDLEGYDYQNLFSGGEFSGVYPGDVPAEPMSTVRQATLFGIHSMIEAEDQFNPEIVFNQVGLVSFATMAHTDLDLSNRLQLTLRTANSRLTTYPGNSYISPHGSGATNIGMGIKRAIWMLTRPGGRGRNYASKTIALLTDGEPTYAISRDFDDEEYDPGTQTEYLTKNTSRGRDYARYWATRCGEAGITLHTIGLGSAGTGANASFLEGLAEEANGTFRPVVSVDSEAEKEALRQLFVAIGKDKLGKLYLD